MDRGKSVAVWSNWMNNINNDTQNASSSKGMHDKGMHNNTSTETSNDDGKYHDIISFSVSILAGDDKHDDYVEVEEGID